MQRLNGWMTALFAGIVVLGAALPAPAKLQRPAVRQEVDPTIVTRVHWQDGKLHLEADHPLNARLFALEAPYRVVIDLYGAELSDPTLLQAIAINEGPYRQLRVALHPEEGFARFVLDCERPTSILLSHADGGNGLDLTPFKRLKGAPLIAMASERLGPEPAPERFGPEPPAEPAREVYGPPLPPKARLVYGPPQPERAREAYGPPAPEPSPAPQPEETPAPEEPVPVWNGDPQPLSAVSLKRRQGVTTLRLEGDRKLSYRLQQEWAPPRLIVRVPKGSFKGALPEAPDGVEGLNAQQDGSDWVLRLDLGRAVYAYDARRKEDGRALEISWRRVPILESRPTVVVDAGHGGDDPGAIGPGGTHEAKLR